VRVLAFAALPCAALAVAFGAAAHTRSQSYSTWTRSGSELRVVFSVAARELAALPSGDAPGFGAQLAHHLETRLQAWSGEQPCEPIGPPRALDASPGNARAELQLHCALPGELSIRVDAFFDDIPSHVHYARVRQAGATRSEQLLTASAREAVALRGGSHSEAGSGPTLWEYVRLGAEHIAGGFDHLAFLLGLLLLCAGIRELLWTATGFTLGHSITLGLAVVGWIRPEARLVEALIGFSIALVAAEAAVQRAGGARALAAVLASGLSLWALKRAARGDAPGALAFGGLALFAPCYLLLCEVPARARTLRPALTFAFGWIHGFGFASQLLSIGVAEDRVLLALFGFNAGVELGQVAALAIFWAASIWIGTRGLAISRSRLAEGLIAALGALGVFWLAARAPG